MMRLCRDSSRSYPGRSAHQSGFKLYGSLTAGHLERDGQPTEPYGRIVAAPSTVTGKVSGQKSAAAIVCAWQQAFQVG